MLRLAVRLLAVAAVMLVSAHAYAQNAAAEALYREAFALAQQGKFAEACPKFAASYELDPQLGTLLDLARCHEDEGRTASAWAEYHNAVSLAQRLGKDATADEAKKRAAELKPMLSNIVVKLDKTLPEMSVTLDGKSVPIGAMGTELPVDPGEHKILVEAPRYKDWNKTVTVPKGPHVETVRVPALVRVTGKGGEPVVVTTGLNDFQVVGYTLGALGLVGLTIGTIFGIVATVQTNAADEHCINTFCTQAGIDGHDRALAFAHISTIGFVVGGASLGTGIILVLTAPSPTAADVEAPAPSPDADPEPSAQSSGWGLSLRGTW
jgi:hypothetical protein